MLCTALEIDTCLVSQGNEGVTDTEELGLGALGYVLGKPQRLEA